MLHHLVVQGNVKLPAPGIKMTQAATMRMMIMRDMQINEKQTRLCCKLNVFNTALAVIFMAPSLKKWFMGFISINAHVDKL
jgi:hypothetical protein